MILQSLNVTNSNAVALLRLSWQLFRHPGWIGLAMRRSTPTEDGYDLETAYYAGSSRVIVAIMDEMKAEGWTVLRSWT